MIRHIPARVGGAATVAAVLLLFVARAAFAQSGEVISARDRMTESAGQMSALPEQPVKPADDFALKRQALGRVINLSLAELSGARERLAAFSTDDAEFILLADLLAEKIVQLERFLGEARSRIADAPDVPAIKALAAELERWRADVYNPALRQAIDFNLVSENTRSLAIAESRFAKFAAYLKRAKALKLATPWEPLLVQAGRELVEAKRFQREAREILRSYLPQAEPEIGVPPGLADEPEEASEPNNDAENIPAISELAAASVSRVKKAYAAFIRIAQEIQGKK